MATKRQIDFIVSAKDEASGVFERVAQSAKKMNLESRQSGEVALERLLKGGGAFGLVHFAGESLDRFAEKLTKIREDMSETGMGWGEAADQMARSLPIIGSIYDAGRKIHDLITGEADELARVNREAKSAEETAKLRLETAEKHKKAIDELLRSIRAAQQEESRIGLSPETARAKAIQDKSHNDTADAPRELEERRRKIEAEYAKRLQDLSKEAQAAGRRKDEVPQQIAVPNPNGKFGEGMYVQNPEYQKRDDEYRALMAQQKALATQRDSEIDQEQKKFNEKQAQENEKGQKELLQLEFEGNLEKAKAKHEAEQKITDIEQQADAQRLHNNHQDREADLAELKAALQRQKAEIDAAQEERNAKFNRAPTHFVGEATRNKEENEEAARQKAALDAKFKADANAANQRADEIEEGRRNEQLRDQADYEQKLGDLKEKALETQLDNAGDHYGAQLEALKAANQKELAEIDRHAREKIEKLRAEHLPDFQARADQVRAQADAEKAAQADLFNQNTRKLQKESSLNSSDYREATLSEGAHLSGEALASAEDQKLSLGQTQLQVQKDTLDVAKENQETLKAMLAALGAQPQSIFSGYGY